MTPAGFPHSDIPGSMTVCVSPRLIAAYHVLHRLLVPRHPPCTLSSLTGYLIQGASTVYTQHFIFDCQRASRSLAARAAAGTGRRRERSCRAPPARERARSRFLVEI